MTDFDSWYSQTVDVETVSSANEWGAQTTVSNTDVPVWIQNKIVLSDGATAESRPITVLFAALSDRPKFTLGSSVTLPDGRVGAVAAVSSNDGDPDLDGITVQLE